MRLWVCADSSARDLLWQKISVWVELFDVWSPQLRVHVERPLSNHEIGPLQYGVVWLGYCNAGRREKMAGWQRALVKNAVSVRCAYLGNRDRLPVAACDDVIKFGLAERAVGD